MNGSNMIQPPKTLVFIQDGEEQEKRLGETQPQPTMAEVIDSEKNKIFRKVSKTFGQQFVSAVVIFFVACFGVLTTVSLILNNINALKGNALEKKITRIEEISVENKQDFLQIIDEKEKIIANKDAIIKQQASLISGQSSIMGQQSEKIIEQEKEIAELKEELVEH